MNDSTNCMNCGRHIYQDEHYNEEINDYGFPVAICDQCQNRNSDDSDYFTGYRLPPGGCS